MRSTVEHQFAQLERRDIAEHLDLAAKQVQPVFDRTLPGERGELASEDRLVGGLEVAVAVDELDHIVALVHAMLDQRIARQCADHVNPGHRGLERRRKRGQREPVGTGEVDPASLDKGARRGRSHPRDDPVAAHHNLAVAGIERDFALVDPRGVGFNVEGDPAGIAGGEQRLDVGILGRGEVGRAVDQADRIALRSVRRQTQRVLDPGVTPADHEDVFVVVFGGIVELVLDHRAVTHRAAHQVGIALCADRQHHRLGKHFVAVLELDGKIARCPGDALNLGIVLDVHTLRGGLFVPAAQHRFALAGIERQVGT